MYPRCSYLWPLLFFLFCFKEAQPKSGCDVTGKVVDAVHGESIAGASASLKAVSSGSLAFTTLTGVDGGFDFRSVTSGAYTLDVTAEGYVTLLNSPKSDIRRVIVIEGVCLAAPLSVRLYPSGRIFGRVIDDFGDAVVSAKITLYRADQSLSKSPKAMNSALSRNDGSFEFINLKSGLYYLSAQGTPWYAVLQFGLSQTNAAIFSDARDSDLDVAFPEAFLSRCP